MYDLFYRALRLSNDVAEPVLLKRELHNGHLVDNGRTGNHDNNDGANDTMSTYILVKNTFAGKGKLRILHRIHQIWNTYTLPGILFAYNILFLDHQATQQNI